LTQEGYQVLANALTHNKGLVTLLFQGGYRASEEEEEEEEEQVTLSPLGLHPHKSSLSEAH
jgi:hypothetical protein